MKITKYENYKIISQKDIDLTLPCVLALGNFDGIHVAHTALLSLAKMLKTTSDAKRVGVWCFDESIHDKKNGIKDPCKIITAEEKIRLFFENGMDFVVLADFEKFRNLPPTDFIENHLIHDLCCVGVVCGYNFKFGHNRLGTPQTLTEYFKDKCVVAKEIQIDNVTVSSTEIRKALADGDIETVNKFLGRPYSLRSVVTHGKKLGRQIGFPTANQTFPCGCAIPKFGVYATICTTEDRKRYVGVSNVGTRPTVEQGDNHKVNCETYILNFNGDIYDKELKVDFYLKLRDEKKFDSLSQLQSAIAENAESAYKLLSEAVYEK